MPCISGGHVQYTRRVKTGDYEHKDIVVLLNWSADVGDIGVEAYASRVADMARGECERLVAGKAAEITAPQAAPALIETPKRGPGRPPKVQAVEITPVDDLDGPTVKMAGPVEDDFGDIIGLPPIDDKTIVDHITHVNARIKNTPAIRALITEFAGPPPSTSAKIPQERRQEFINRLEGLK